MSLIGCGSPSGAAWIWNSTRRVLSYVSARHCEFIADGAGLYNVDVDLPATFRPTALTLDDTESFLCLVSPAELRVLLVSNGDCGNVRGVIPLQPLRDGSQGSTETVLSAHWQAEHAHLAVLLSSGSIALYSLTQRTDRAQRVVRIVSAENSAISCTADVTCFTILNNGELLSSTEECDLFAAARGPLPVLPAAEDNYSFDVRQIQCISGNVFTLASRNGLLLHFIYFTNMSTEKVVCLERLELEVETSTDDVLISATSHNEYFVVFNHCDVFHVQIPWLSATGQLDRRELELSSSRVQHVQMGRGERFVCTVKNAAILSGEGGLRLYQPRHITMLHHSAHKTLHSVLSTESTASSIDYCGFVQQILNQKPSVQKLPLVGDGLTSTMAAENFLAMNYAMLETQVKTHVELADMVTRWAGEVAREQVEQRRKLSAVIFSISTQADKFEQLRSQLASVESRVSTVFERVAALKHQIPGGDSAGSLAQLDSSVRTMTSQLAEAEQKVHHLASMSGPDTLASDDMSAAERDFYVNSVSSEARLLEDLVSRANQLKRRSL